MVLAITSQKGGVGKSTLAFNLATFFARDGVHVCIADSDDNQTCLRWFGARQEAADEGAKLPVVEVYSTPDETLKAQLRMLRQKYELVIIDGMPSLGKTNTKILYSADYALIPILAGGPDSSTLGTFLQRIEDVNQDRDFPLSTGVVLNRFDARISLVRDLQEALQDHPLGVYPEVIGQRGIFTESFLRGLSIEEIKDAKGRTKNQQAVDELNRFYWQLVANLKQLPSARILANLNEPVLA